MSKHDINKAYISPYDKFFHLFDGELSASQLDAIKKQEWIAKHRDEARPPKTAEEIWEDF